MCAPKQRDRSRVTHVHVWKDRGEERLESRGGSATTRIGADELDRFA